LRRKGIGVESLGNRNKRWRKKIDGGRPKSSGGGPDTGSERSSPQWMVFKERIFMLRKLFIRKGKKGGWGKQRAREWERKGRGSERRRSTKPV